MPTPDMSDEELDRLFQRGAEAYPDEVSLSGWLQLEDQLNAADQQRLVQQQVRRQVARWFAAELVLVALLALLWNQKSGWQLRQPTSNTPDATAAQTLRPAAAQQLNRRVQQQPEAAATARNTPPDQIAPVAALAAAASATGVTGSPAASEASVGSFHKSRRVFVLPNVAGQLVASSGRSRSSFRADEPGKQHTASAIGTAGTATALAVSATNPPSIMTKASVEQSVSLSSAANPAVPNAGVGNTPAITAAPGSILAPEAITATDAAAGTAAVLPADSAATAPRVAPTDSTTQKPSQPKPAYRLLVGLIGGPEATAVLPGPTPRVGGTMGVALEYRLTPRIRVRTGLTRSIKRYAAKGADYNPPPTYWTHRIPVDQIDANCRILEIPLDVRYDVAVRPGHTFYASAGLTSLLMRHERYRYLYELNGNYIDRTWSIDRSGNAAFSLLQLSVGMERAVGSRWLVQAEPFVKVPLGGVGFGQVKLSSSGILLGIKYGLFRPRTAAP
ncbi:PorT family protein [Hymenobacter rigui]|uniref:PorT family protein n=1 Tax=Hymenobacter rigui TaxID=334424 RepID=A0A3R9MQR0_9BACT|nr:PorT family protein [Hymenobacter rigui]RSK51323.1 PorT family protein [Hymenobacter rigui]